MTTKDIEANVLSGGRISWDVSGFLLAFRGIDNVMDLIGAPNDTPATYCLRTNRITDDVITHYDHGGITRTEIANQLYVRSEVMTPRK